MRARAEMNRVGSPGWHVGILDNTQDDGLYVLDSDTFLLGASGATRDLHAASGWGGSSYTSERAAAPFAILDTVYDAMQFVLASEPGLTFPVLQIHWSVEQCPSVGANGPVASTGQIGSSFYDSANDIYLLGAQDNDTDEYDRSVISQAWGQYLADSFGRDDGAAGPHAAGDQLDLRAAFREGWGNAIAAIVTGDPVYRDTQGPHQAQGVSFNVEGEPATMPESHPGWFSERSIGELIYNVYDSSSNFVPAGSTTQDNVALGFGPIFDALSRSVEEHARSNEHFSVRQCAATSRGAGCPSQHRCARQSRRHGQHRRRLRHHRDAFRHACDAEAHLRLRQR